LAILAKQSIDPDFSGGRIVWIKNALSNFSQQAVNESKTLTNIYSIVFTKTKQAKQQKCKVRVAKKPESESFCCLKCKTQPKQ